MNETKNNYEAPRVEVVEVEVEKGYAASVNSQWFGNEQDWDKPGV